MTHTSGQGLTEGRREAFGRGAELQDVAEQPVLVGLLVGAGADKEMRLSLHGEACGRRTKGSVGGAVIKAMLKCREPSVDKLDDAGVIGGIVFPEGQVVGSPVNGVDLEA